MEQRDVVRYVLQILDEMNLRYCVVGSFASIAYGEARMTHDIDIVIELPLRRIKELCAKFTGKDWYVNDATAREAVLLRRQFNVVNTKSGSKIDFMIARDDAWGSLQLQRRRREPVLSDYEGYVAHPEDIILGKLLYYQEGQSEKHPRDIAGMLNYSGHLIDRVRIAEWAERLGVRDLWEAIVAKVDAARPPAT